MEIIGVILALGGIYLFFYLIGIALRSLKAVGKTAFGGGTLQENFELEFKGMPAFDIQVNHQESDDEYPFERFEILGKGVFPNTYKTRLLFVTQVFDESDTLKPILSTSTTFQSDDNPFYSFERKAEVYEPGYGFMEWSNVGLVITDVLIPPKSGSRNLRIILSILDSDQQEIQSYSKTKNYFFEDQGYEEAIEAREEAYLLDIQLAVYMGYSDNDFDRSEAQLIKNWMIKTLKNYESEKKENLRVKFNKTFKQANSEAKEGKLSISRITSRLNEIADDRMKYQSIEFCLDIMAADGIADEGELEAVRKISESLGLDFDEVQKLKDLRLKDLKMSINEDTSLEELIGIKPSFSKEETCKHLRNEFKKWNSRLTGTDDLNVRQNAQQKLDIIAELNSKYCD